MAQTPQLEELPEAPGSHRGISLLTLGALGVVFGDIGTSPLYAFKAAFSEELFQQASTVPQATEVAHVMGVLSLFVWAIIIVLCLKYVIFMMRADNEGEGGVLAMFSLLQDKKAKRAGKSSLVGVAGRGGLVFLAIIGAALLYGDGVITPAISVLAASEGINLATGGSIPHWVAPLSAVVILVILFTLQRFGTGQIGFLFGPVMLIWFLVIGALGVGGIIQNPEVLQAINPMWGIDLFLSSPWLAFVLLGAVVLCVTGCEALSLDMGHFGRTPIRIAWFSLVCPALLLNYFGQAALLLSSRGVPSNPFYLLVPDMLLIPMIVLSVTAAVIASQAIIAGAFSITRQAIQLLLLPPTAIRHTSKSQEGQIYVPTVNRWMLVFSVILVLAFQTSDNLGAAYGLAVTGVMTTSTIMLALVARRVWGWSWFVITPLLLGFFVVDLAFLGANLLKVPSGGWVPLAIGLVLMVLMTTWLRGIRLMDETRSEIGESVTDFMTRVEEEQPIRIPGGGVFMTSDRESTPLSLLKLYRHMPVLHEEVVFVHFELVGRPRVPKSERVEITDLGGGFWQMICPIGYLQEPYLPRLVKLAAAKGMPVKPDRITYYTRRDLPSRVHGHHMSAWRKELFFAMLRNARGPANLLSLPSDQVIEVGVRINY
ncbi:MAG: KUP/HAK/KT family potassium transporter [Phycisphaerales bacterium]|nr:KUP/HAK/KT family potassium transporter [Phycisphaerales bacterium]